MDFSSCPLLPLYTREALYRLSAVDRGLAEPAPPPPGSAAKPAEAGGSKDTTAPSPWAQGSVLAPWPPSETHHCSPGPGHLSTSFFSILTSCLSPCHGLSCPVESEMLWLPPDTLSSLGAFLLRDRPRPHTRPHLFSHHHVLSAFPKQKEQIIKT